MKTQKNRYSLFLAFGFWALLTVTGCGLSSANVDSRHNEAIDPKTRVAIHEINNKILESIAPSGIKILKTYFCPHGADAGCACYKPKPGLLLDAQKEFDIDLADSWMIGDRPSDVMTGINAGTKTILVKSGVPTVESDEATFIAPSLLEAAQYIASH